MKSFQPTLRIILAITLLSYLSSLPAAEQQPIKAQTPSRHLKAMDTCPAYLNHSLRKLHSKKTLNVCDLYQAGKPILVVNTASHCGFTKQFGGLEALHKKYSEIGLTILGFPSNSFNQEEKSESGTAKVCFINFGVTFNMFEHVDVKGDSAHPIFKHLSEETRSPSWNFNKYLIYKGEIEHFGSKTKPEGSELEKKIKTMTF